MVKVMKTVAMIGFASTVLFIALNYILDFGFILPLAITAGVITYHFAVRLAVGYAVDGIFKNRFDYSKRWFRQKAFEPRLYEILCVKKWKDKMPTASPELFDLKTAEFESVAQAMCQAEIVHEINVIMSFIPLIAAVWFGDFWVFLITSLLAAGYDMLFVIMQRYNRPRFVRLAERKKQK